MIKIFNTETKIPYIILFIVAIVSIYPFFYMISTSFMTVGEATQASLIEYAESDDGILNLEADEEENELIITKMLQLIVSAPEFQFA